MWVSLRRGLLWRAAAWGNAPALPVGAARTERLRDRPRLVPAPCPVTGRGALCFVSTRVSDPHHVLSD